MTGCLDLLTVNLLTGITCTVEELDHRPPVSVEDVTDRLTVGEERADTCTELGKCPVSIQMIFYRQAD